MELSRTTQLMTVALMRHCITMAMTKHEGAQLGKERLGPAGNHSRDCVMRRAAKAEERSVYETARNNWDQLFGAQSSIQRMDCQ